MLSVVCQENRLSVLFVKENYFKTHLGIPSKDSFELHLDIGEISVIILTFDLG